MDLNINLPSEILDIIFQYLSPQDLISCSRTCWSWNASANPLLYETVTFSSNTKFQRFIEGISASKNPHGEGTENTRGSHQALGQLVKAAEIISGYSHHDEIREYAMVLSRLASETPNVHTATLVLLVMSEETGPPPYWRTLASQWSKLKSLTLSGSLDYGVETYDLDGLKAVFHRLQHLDVTRCSDILSYMLSSLPTMPYLQSLMATIYSTTDYKALKTVVRNTLNTLNTCIIEFNCARLPALDPENLQLDHKNLKILGFTVYGQTQINITNIGDNLEHLRYWVFSSGAGSLLDQSIRQAMLKTSHLKTLSLAGDLPLEHIALVLEANKNSLHTFFFHHTRAGDLITLLQASNVRLYNVTTLCFDCSSLENAHVLDLAEIFPNVESLALCRNTWARDMTTMTMFLLSERISDERREADYWIATDALSQFRQLKALDKTSFLELEDQQLCTYRKCSIFSSSLKLWANTA